MEEDSRSLLNFLYSKLHHVLTSDQVHEF